MDQIRALFALAEAAGVRHDDMVRVSVTNLGIDAEVQITLGELKNAVRERPTIVNS